MDLIRIIAGASTGLIVGLTGVGGGALMTPLLLLFSVAPLAAVGIDLCRRHHQTLRNARASRPSLMLLISTENGIILVIFSTL